MSKTYRVKVKEVSNAPEGYSRVVKVLRRGSLIDTLALDSEQYDYEYEVSDGAEFRVNCEPFGLKSDYVITTVSDKQSGLVVESDSLAIYAPKTVAPVVPVEPEPEPVVPVEPEPEPEVPDSDDSDSSWL
jgi:hypothetical protein